MCDWDWMVEHLAAQAPYFEPGTETAYHTINWGWPIGEIVRRTDRMKRSFADFVREEILEPLGVEHLHLRLPESEIPRVATLTSDMIPPPPENHLLALAAPPAAAPNPAVFGRSDVWMSEIPAANGLMTANAVARVYAMLSRGGELHGVRLLSEERVRSFAQPRDNPDQIDRVNNRIRVIGKYGYWLGGTSPHAEKIVGTGTHIIHHPGAGGSIAWADLDERLAVAITHNRMFTADVLPPERQPLLPIADAVRRIAADARR
jgi:CubicO group peptidase (beta-lactamase class C family)